MLLRLSSYMQFLVLLIFGTYLLTNNWASKKLSQFINFHIQKVDHIPFSIDLLLNLSLSHCIRKSRILLWRLSPIFCWFYISLVIFVIEALKLYAFSYMQLYAVSLFFKDLKLKKQVRCLTLKPSSKTYHFQHSIETIFT